MINNPHDPLNDGISAVTLVDSMGDDLTAVNAARVSMHRFSTNLSKQDEKLIDYLARHNHWTPFSHAMLTFRIKMPIFIARQWFKHQVGFTRNEVSRRYVSDTPEFYVPQTWREAAANVKQGSSNRTHHASGEMSAEAKHLASRAAWFYRDIIEAGVAPEQARMVLPQSMYTEFYETASLMAYARLVLLRLDSHAQAEVRWYARAVADQIRPKFPKCWDALTTPVMEVEK